MHTLTDMTGTIANAMMKPTAILVAYDKNNYIEMHKIDEKGHPLAAQPVTKQFINSLLEGFSNTYKLIPHGPMPGNILYADTRSGHEKYIWYSRPGKRRQVFAEPLNMQDGEYMMPGCIYMVEKDNLYVYAYAGKKNPDLKTQLLKGPFFNYHPDAKICLGDARVKIPNDMTWQNLINSWEDLFWNSVNSHTMHGHNPVKGNLCLVLKEQKDKKTFNTDILEKTIYKVSDLMKK